MKVNEVSRRYAKALLALAKQKGIHAKAFQELKTLSEAFSADVTIKSYFENPMVSPDQKAAAVKATLKGQTISEEVVNTILLLAEKNRISLLGEVTQAFQELLDVEEGVTRGVVRSAQPLQQDAKSALEQKISKLLSKKIVLTYEQDPKLLGGVVAQVGGWTFDDSIDTHLKKLNEELNRRAN